MENVIVICMNTTMNNTTRVQIKFFGDKKNINAVLNWIKGDYSNVCIDFNRIRSAPCNIYDGHSENKDACERIRYNWAMENWGTGYNAFNSCFNENNNSLTFDVVGNFPKQIIEGVVLIGVYNNVKMLGRWASNHKGCNTGYFAPDYNKADCLGDIRYNDCSSVAYKTYAMLYE